MTRYYCLILIFLSLITRLNGQTITASNDTTICIGGTASLHATVTGGGFGTTSYTFEQYTYSPEPYTGGTGVQFAANQDDQIAGPYDIGFNFCFFNQLYTQFYIGSNGWVGFEFNNAWTTFTAAPIPNTAAAVPKNCIMAPWQDWWPGWVSAGNTSGTNVYYYISGSAPNRKLVVYWIFCPLYNCTGSPANQGTFQIVLNEQNSIIENHIQKKPNCSSSENATQGVHNADGTVAFTAVGRNCTPWTATNESTRFVPSGIIWYSGGYPGGTIAGYGADLTVSPLTTTTYTVVIQQCTGGAATDDVIVTVRDATFNYHQLNYCQSDADPVPNVLQSGGTFTSSPAGIVFVNDLTGEIDLSASTPGSYTITHTITTPCLVTYSEPLNIIATPIPPPALEDTVWRCGPGAVTLQVTQAPGTVIKWFDAPTGGSLYPFGGGTITPNVTVTTTFYAEAISITNACVSLTRTPVVAFVKPIPVIANSILHLQQCSEATTSIDLVSSPAGATFTWTANCTYPAITGYADGNGPAIVQTLFNTGNLTDSVRYHIMPEKDGCPGIPSDIYVKVLPVPDVVADPVAQSICGGGTASVSLGSAVAGTTFSWTATASSPTITGYSDGTGNLISQVISHSGVVAEVLTYQISPSANGCDGLVFDYPITVNPVPLLTVTPMRDSICSVNTTNIHLTATCAGTTFSWTAQLNSGNITGFGDGSGDLIAQSLTNLLTTTGEVWYSVTPVAGTCSGTDTTYYMAVKPTPHSTTSPNAYAQCSNATTNIALTADVTGTAMAWSAAGSSPQVTGFAPGTGNLIAQTLLNSGFSNETVTYTLTPSALNCTGPDSIVTVTVYPVPDAYFVPDALTQCSAQTTGIQVLSHVTGTTFAWTATGSSPQVTGYADGTGNLIAQTLTNTGTSIETVTYTATPTANGCTGTPFSIVVTVNPSPQVTITPASQTLCSGIATSAGLTSGVAGTTFSWTVTGSSPQVTGFTAGTGNSIAQTLTNAGFNIETVTYHITPAANGCDGPAGDFTVTVNPVPDLSNTPPSAQVCNNTSPNTTLTSNVAGTLFTWICTPSSGNVTGWSDNTGTPTTLLDQALGNTSLNIESVTYHMTPHANGCDGPVNDYTVTVVSLPDVYFTPPAQTLCSQATSSIQVLSHVPGATFAWTTAASSTNLSGYADGTGNLIAQTIANSGNTTETVTYTVAPAAFGCPPGVPQNVILTVNPEPAITNAVTTSAQCSGSLTSIILNSTVPGSTYTWTATGSSAAVTGYSAGTGLSITQNLINTGFNNETVTYSVTPIANSCPGDAVPFDVTVYPVPDVYFTPLSQVICSGTTTNLVLASHVAGASYTWTATGSTGNVTGYSAGSGDLIQQALSNSGYNVETVTYTAAPMANGCPGVSNLAVVTVNPLPVVTLPVCFDTLTTTSAAPITLRGNVPAGGVYSGTGVSGKHFYPGIAGEGTHTVTYGYTNAYGCSSQASLTITVQAPVPLTCGNTVTDIRDGKSYPTVQIGTQCWMAANLDFGNTVASGVVQRDNCVTEKYCYGDNPANCGTSGGLYQWDEVMRYEDVAGIQGFCMPGWHIPSEAEWGTLFNFYTSNGFAGSPLKVTGFSGFNALLNGVRFNNSNWNFLNFATMFWSSGSHGPKKSWAHGMNTENPSVSYYPAMRTNAFQVRCLRD